MKKRVTYLVLSAVIGVLAFACSKPPQQSVPSPTPTPTATTGAVVRLANIGTQDPRWNPVVSGGISKKDLHSALADVETNSWEEGKTTTGHTDVYMVFRASDVPGGFAVWRTTVPAGTEYIFDRRTGHAAASACGNPTCWRWLVEHEEPMLNEGPYDPPRDALVRGGLTAEDRAKLEQMGWERAVTEDVRRNVEMAAPSTGVQLPVLLRKFDVPKGTEYYFNRKDGRAIIAAGGNATAAEWLITQRLDGESTRKP
jgi:hypothetical protein